jgi:hypothetical protein
VREPVTPPKDPLAVRVVAFWTNVHCAAARAAISCAVYEEIVVRNPLPSLVTSATWPAPDARLNEKEVSLAAGMIRSGTLPSFTAKETRGSEPEPELP